MALTFKKKVIIPLLSKAFVFAVLLSSCNNSTPNNNSILPNRPTDVTKTIPTEISVLGTYIHSLALPFKDTCYDTMTVQKRKIPDSLSKFKTYGQFIGKVSETRQYIAILYSIPADVQLPVLHTFNANGDKISSLKLFIGNCCGENEGCSGLSTVQITRDLHIILKDSMQTFERNKRKFTKKKDIQTFKKYEEYKIDSTGKILKVGAGDLP